MRGAALLALAACGAASRAPASAVPSTDVAAARTGIDAFNDALTDATRRMDNDAALALWDDDGASLLPQTPPIIGKPALRTFLTNVTASLAGAHMISFELHCDGLDVGGDWASEWCTEHQVVALPGDKPPFDGRGTMLLVLHRGPDARWRLHREMWNQAAPAK